MADTTDRLNAALEGRYRIKRQLGQGGMATVYLADDLKHERRVALKVLKPELAAVVGAERFLAEIRTTANLQHPHILPLHDSGEADGLLFYVMPFVKGESLRQRLKREHQLSVDDSVNISSKVATALDYAHRQGVIHRDIKPANILLSETGEPLVSDFGIALAVSGGGGRLTETGLSLGTPRYMSPEQATGDLSVGPATDIWAVGCVLYEMLTSEPPFTGSTPQAVLGKIISEPPPRVTNHRQSAPPNVESAISMALEKVPADRFGAAADFVRALGDPTFRHGQPERTHGVPGPARWKRRAYVAASLAVLFGLSTLWLASRPGPTRPIARFASPLADGQVPMMPMELTSDGSALVYAGARPSGAGSQLWIRRWNDLAAVPIPGTEGVYTGPGLTQLTISPDQTEVAFVVGNRGALTVVPISGGPSRTLTDSASGASAWTDDGWVYFHRGVVVHRVRDSGGREEMLTEIAPGEGYHVFPHPLPGGQNVLFQVSRGVIGQDSEIWSLDLDTRQRRRIVEGNRPRYVPTGHLLFGTPDGRIMAAPFDPDVSELRGRSVPVAEGLFTSPGESTVEYSVSPAGSLVYRRGSASAVAEFVWVGRDGRVSPADPGLTIRRYANFSVRLSPDEDRLVYNDYRDGVQDVFVKHLPDGPEEQITFSDSVDLRPFWGPDGQRVYYFSGPSPADRNLWSRRADGTGERELVLDGERSLARGSWSSDGAWLILRTGANAAMGMGGRDIIAFRPEFDRTPVTIVASQFVEGAPSVSPDGRWLTYTSNETGRQEVFILPFPDTESGRVRVSTDGGREPRWSKDGRELFYVDGASSMVAVRFDPVSGHIGERETLFLVPPLPSGDPFGAFFDVTSDGERFLMVRRIEEGVRSDVVLVQNFFEELKRMAPN